MWNPITKPITVTFEKIVSEISTQVTVENIYTNQSSNFWAVWDTGATHTAVSQSVVDTLSLPATGRNTITGVGSSTPIEANTHDVNILLPNDIKIEELEVSSCLSPLSGCDVLIGMDIITLGDFAITNLDGKTVMTFAIPSYERLDFVHRVNSLNILIQNNEKE